MPKRASGRKWHAGAVRAWRAWWRSDHAGVYNAEDAVAMERLLLLVDKQYRAMDGDSVTIYVKGEPIEMPLEMTGSEMTTMAALEDRLGLSPRARQTLGWDGGEAKGVRSRTPSSAAAGKVDPDRKNRLRAV